MHQMEMRFTRNYSETSACLWAPSNCGITCETASTHARTLRGLRNARLRKTSAVKLILSRNGHRNSSLAGMWRSRGKGQIITGNTRSWTAPVSYSRKEEHENPLEFPKTGRTRSPKTEHVAFPKTGTDPILWNLTHEPRELPR